MTVLLQKSDDRIAVVNGHWLGRGLEPQQALDLARQILGNAQVAVRGAKRCIDHAADCERTTAYDLEVANPCYAAKERKEGVSRCHAERNLLFAVVVRRCPFHPYALSRTL